MYTILIVDDSPTIRRMVKASLGGLPGAAFAEAGSGLQAIEALAVRPVQMVVLDLNMPGVDGMEVCRFIKRDPVAGDTPVVFVTAEDDPGTKARAREAGAMDYLIKPVDIDRLEEILDKLPRKITLQKPTEKPDAAKAD